MTDKLRPLYQDMPELMQRDHAALQKIFQNIAGESIQQVGEQPVAYKTHTGDWDITLSGSSSGELGSASMSRLGSEEYKFIRTGAEDWSATGQPHSFESAQYFNLVVNAGRTGLVWTA